MFLWPCWVFCRGGSLERLPPTTILVKGAASTVPCAAHRGRCGAAWGHSGGAVLFSQGRQPWLYQLKAGGTGGFRGCRFCIVNEGNDCRIRRKRVLSGAQDRSCHRAILYSIRYPPGRVDPTEVIITALYTHTTIYILALSHPLALATSRERWYHYLHVAAEETEAERLNNLLRTWQRGDSVQPCWLLCIPLFEPGVLTN